MHITSKSDIENRQIRQPWSVGETGYISRSAADLWCAAFLTFGVQLLAS